MGVQALTKAAGGVALLTAAAAAIGGIIVLAGEERHAVTSSEIESMPGQLSVVGWFASALLVVAVSGWFAALGVGILRRRRWAWSAGLATFAVGAVLALVIATDIDPEKAVGTADPVEGAGAPAYAIAGLDAAAALILLLPAVRADFRDAWLGRLGPKRRAETEDRRAWAANLRQ